MSIQNVSEHREQIAGGKGQIRPEKQPSRSKNPEKRRRQAVERYLKGEKIEAICLALSCSKSWLYKWLKRYQKDDPNWVKEKARRPRSHPEQTSVTLCGTIVHLEKALRKNGRRAGATVIEQALKRKGIDKVPSRSTIYRILSRHEKEGKNP